MSENPGEKLNHPPAERGRANLLPGVIALLLYAAAGLKLAQYLQDGFRSYPQLHLLEILFEIVLASALISGFARSFVIKFTAVVFCVFLTVTLYRALGGFQSCGCFGAVKVNPWITSLLDLSIIILILSYLRTRRLPGRLLAGFGLFAVILTAAMLATAWMVYYFRPAHLTPDGKLLGGHGPITCNPPSWYGKKLPLMRFIQSATPLQTGSWLVVLYYHQCPDCHAEIRLIEKHLIHRVKLKQRLPHVALLQIPPFGNLPEDVHTRYMHLLRMKSARRWIPPFLPVLIGIHNGVVNRVGTRVPGQWFGFSTPQAVRAVRKSARAPATVPPHSR
ncbi:MAG: hypothetical protein ACP5QA_15350 [Phycisphaerae bacterium]